MSRAEQTGWLARLIGRIAGRRENAQTAPSSGVDSPESLAADLAPDEHLEVELHCDEMRELPLEDSIDLHTFAPRDVAEVVAAYIDAAVEAGLREVRIIHGRGIGVQREIVRKTLARHPGVHAVEDAPGNWGATVAQLEKNPPTPSPTQTVTHPPRDDP